MKLTLNLSKKLFKRGNSSRKEKTNEDNSILQQEPVNGLKE
jgi:hypothetical protein